MEVANLILTLVTLVLCGYITFKSIKDDIDKHK